jgi:hypothetical protein
MFPSVISVRAIGRPVLFIGPFAYRHPRSPSNVVRNATNEAVLDLPGGKCAAMERKRRVDPERGRAS